MDPYAEAIEALARQLHPEDYPPVVEVPSFPLWGDDARIAHNEDRYYALTSGENK